MTFFLWPGARRGRIGKGQVSAIGFAVPEGSLEFWRHRAQDHGQRVEPIEDRLGDTGLALRDPDGLQIELVESGPGGPARADVPGEAAIGGFFSAALSLGDIEPTRELVQMVMGFEPVSDDGNRFRLQAASGTGRFVDLVKSSEPWGQSGAGTNHHIAFRASDDVDQIAWRKLLLSKGFDVTTVRDRTYFNSIYFREPGGVLFEIATDTPGFPVDEPVATLGEDLKLPAWLEKSRGAIEAALPSLVGTK
jgi:glyoxalase family protein